eukprot:1362845-Alexandrium_andersonii.AAC.1
MEWSVDSSAAFLKGVRDAQPLPGVANHLQRSCALFGALWALADDRADTNVPRATCKTCLDRSFDFKR